MKKARRICSLFATIIIGICGFGGCGGKTTETDKLGQDITVYMPDGAPAMAFAKMMQEDTADDGLAYRVVDPTTIATNVTYKDMSKNADICALPVIAAAKLLGGGENYQMLGVLTSGNLYVLTNQTAVVDVFENSQLKSLSHLIGKTVGVMQINNVPGMTFKCILNDYGVAWQELTNDAEVAADKINLKPIANATAINPQDESVACYVVAEPAASVQIKNNGFTSVCSLTQLYHKGEVPMGIGQATYYGYPQAVLVAKKSLIQEKSDWIKEFLTAVKASGEALKNPDSINGAQIVAAVQAHLEDSGYATTLKAPVLTFETINRCGVAFAENSLTKNAVMSYLQRILAVNPNVTKLPDENNGFFYGM